jgi:ribosomal protein S18 acetylase RimI-like enzyme
MEIVQFKDWNIEGIVNIWNHACKTGMPYKPFTESGFREKFINNPHFSYEGTFVAIERDKVIGFANGICKKDFLPGENHENTPGYITFVLVDYVYRRKGIGEALLKKVEDSLVNKGKKQLDIIFFNPINLEWFVTGKEGADHPNSPGVDVESNAYKFFLKNGYKDRARQNSYYMNIREFKLNEKGQNILEGLKNKDISIEYYDSSRHYGFELLFEDLKNEHWKVEIMKEVQGENSSPVLIANHKGRICGFTGPLKVQPSGRGYFAGIGVHSAYGGMGIGTALFSKLCEGLKEEGAAFMTLFTGENNPARKMYEGAGFEIVKTWAVLRKEI